MRKFHHSSGFTLLETLVTLVVMAMVASLLFEGLFQLGRLEQRLGSEKLLSQTSRLRDVWLQQMLEGLLPGAKDTPDRFRGQSRELEGLSSLAPMVDADGPHRVLLQLRRVSGSDATELLLSFLAADTVSTEPIVLARWPGDRGQWRYLADSGEWLTSWPPPLGQAPALPKAIALQEGDRLVVLATPATQGEALGRRVDREDQP